MQKFVSTVVRGAFVTAAIATLVAASPAHATGDWWSWWSDLPSWWPFKPQPVSTPEIDAGLVRGAVAIIAGSLVMMRSRKKRSD